MKKIILLSFIALLFGMTGCSFYIDSDGVHTYDNNPIDDAYKFNDYESFLNIKDDKKTDSKLILIDEYKEMKTNKVDIIETSTVFENISIIRENRDNIKIHYFGIFDLTSDDKEPEYTINTGRTFTFKVNWKTLIGKSCSLMTIYIPLDYDGDINVSSTSGNIEADDLALGEVTFSTTSGDIDVKNIESEKIDIRTVSGSVSGVDFYGSEIYVNSTSGNIGVEYLEGNKVIIKTVSGDYKANKIKSDSIAFDSTSGKLIVEELISDYIDLDTVSGDLKFSINNHQGDIIVKTVSGNVDITIDGKVDTEFDIDSTSGDIICNYRFDSVEKKDENILKAIIDSGKHLLKIDTVSGDVSIN